MHDYLFTFSCREIPVYLKFQSFISIFTVFKNMVLNIKHLLYCQFSLNIWLYANWNSTLSYQLCNIFCLPFPCKMEKFLFLPPLFSPLSCFNQLSHLKCKVLLLQYVSTQFGVPVLTFRARYTVLYLVFVLAMGIDSDKRKYTYPVVIACNTNW